MDIIGFLLVLAAIGFAPRFGVDDALLTIGRAIRERSYSAYEAFHERYRGLAVRPTQLMLYASAVVQMALFSFAVIAFLDWERLPASFIAVGGMTTLIAAWEIFEAYRIRVAEPRYEIVDEQVPRLDDAGNQVLGPLDIPMQDTVTVERLEAYPGYAPERFSMFRALMLVIAGFGTLAVGLGALGIQTESRPLFLMGAMAFFSILLVVRLMASFIAWALEKGVKLIEKLATIAVEQGLIALPAITRDNIRQHLPFGVNILEEEIHAARIRALAWHAARYASPFIIFVAVFTNPTAAAITGTFLLISTLAWWYLAQEGGALEAAEMRYKTARLLAYTMPALLLVSLIWPLLPEGLKGYLAGMWDGAIGVFTGETAIPFLTKWWQNVLFGGAMVMLLWFLANIAGAVGRNASESRIGRGLFYSLLALCAIPALLIAWSITGLGMNALGKDSFRLKEAKAALLPGTPAAERPKPKAQSQEPAGGQTSGAESRKPKANSSKPGVTTSKTQTEREPQGIASGRVAAGRGCSPDFVEAYRRIVGPNANPPCVP